MLKIQYRDAKDGGIEVLRCFSKEDMLFIVSKLRKFTTANDRKLLDEVIRREIYHYHEVRSDCDSVINNLWRLVQCIDGKKAK